MISALDPYRDRIAATIKPYVKIESKPCKNDDLDIRASKFGGNPYWPIDWDYPENPNFVQDCTNIDSLHDRWTKENAIAMTGFVLKNWSDRYLYLVAQINFAEVPALPGFPEDGILQFFIANNSDLGMELGAYFHYLEMASSHGKSPHRPFPHFIRQDTYRVVYHPDPTRECVRDFDFLDKRKPLSVFRSSSCFSLSFEHKESPITWGDGYFEKELGFDRDSGLSDLYAEEFPSYCNHQIGGYPSTAQKDPRLLFDPKREYISLFTICSQGKPDNYYILWGDLGVANLFIKREDLLKRDFSNVVYYWDCC